MQKFFYSYVTTMYDGLTFSQKAVHKATSAEAVELYIMQSGEWVHDDEDEVIDYIEVKEITEEEYKVLEKYI